MVSMKNSKVTIKESYEASQKVHLSQPSQQQSLAKYIWNLKSEI